MQAWGRILSKCHPSESSRSSWSHSFAPVYSFDMCAGSPKTVYGGCDGVDLKPPTRVATPHKNPVGSGGSGLLLQLVAYCCIFLTAARGFLWPPLPHAQTLGLIFGGLVDELIPLDKGGRMFAGKGVRYGWLPFMDFMLLLQDEP